jgi:hypothetical protein
LSGGVFVRSFRAPLQYVCQSFYSKNCNKEGLIIQIDKNDSVYNTEPTDLSIEEELKVVAAPLLYTPQMGKVVGNIKRSALFYNWTTQRLKCGWNN